MSEKKTAVLIPCYNEALTVEKVINDFKRALPDAEIVDGGQPTDHGWRVGPHYETIYEIFHTDRYVPFADSFPEAGDGP